MSPSRAPTDTGTAQTERVHDRLRRAIITGEIAAGAKLKIMPIAQEDGVSPGAVREALSRLISDHLVVPLHQRGFRVAQLSLPDMLDLYATRASLERQLVIASSRNARADWRAALSASFAALEQAGSQPLVSPATASVHEAFHRALVQGCGSAWSMRLFEQLYTASERYRYCAFRLLTSHRPVAQEHAELFAAAFDGRAELAGELAYAHTMQTRELLSAALERIDEGLLP